MTYGSAARLIDALITHAPKRKSMHGTRSSRIDGTRRRRLGLILFDPSLNANDKDLRPSESTAPDDDSRENPAR